MRSFRLAVATVFLAALPVAASASPINFTETVLADGSLGSTNFTDTLVTLSGSGDTSSIDVPGTGFYTLDLTSATVQVGAGPAASFTDIIEVISDQGGPTAAFSDALAGDILDDTNSAFASYSLDTAISQSGTALINPGLGFITSDGLFELTATDSQSTFSSSLGTAAAPEPSSLALLATGLLGLGEIARRRRRAA